MCIGTVGLWDYTVFQSLIKIWKQKKKSIIKQNRGRKISVLMDSMTYRTHIEVCRCFTATSGRTRDCCEGPARGLQFDIPKILKLSNLVSPSVWLLISSVPTDWSHLVTPVEITSKPETFDTGATALSTRMFQLIITIQFILALLTRRLLPSSNSFFPPQNFGGSTF